MFAEQEKLRVGLIRLLCLIIPEHSIRLKVIDNLDLYIEYGLPRNNEVLRIKDRLNELKTI